MYPRPRVRELIHERDGSFHTVVEDGKTQADCTESRCIRYVRLWDRSMGWFIGADVRMSDGTYAQCEGRAVTLADAFKSFWTSYYTFAPRTERLVLPPIRGN